MEHVAARFGVSARPARGADILQGEGRCAGNPGAASGCAAEPPGRGRPFAVQAMWPAGGGGWPRVRGRVTPAQVAGLHALQRELSGGEAGSWTGSPSSTTGHRTIQPAAVTPLAPCSTCSCTTCAHLLRAGRRLGRARPRHAPVLDALTPRPAAARDAMAEHIRHIGRLLVTHLERTARYRPGPASPACDQATPAAQGARTRTEPGGRRSRWAGPPARADDSARPRLPRRRPSTPPRASRRCAASRCPPPCRPPAALWNSITRPTPRLHSAGRTRPGVQWTWSRGSSPPAGCLQPATGRARSARRVVSAGARQVTPTPGAPGDQLSARAASIIGWLSAEMSRCPMTPSWFTRTAMCWKADMLIFSRGAWPPESGRAAAPAQIELTLMPSPAES